MVWNQFEVKNSNDKVSSYCSLPFSMHLCYINKIAKVRQLFILYFNWATLLVTLTLDFD